MSSGGWTDERTALAIRLWTVDGYSASQIAKTLGAITRNAVIGRLARLGYTGEGVGARQRASEPKRAPAPKPKATRSAPGSTHNFWSGKPVAKLKIAGRGTVFEEAPARKPFAGVQGDAWAVLSGSNPKPFHERKLNQCSWPVNTPGVDLMCCCLPVRAMGWCAEHAKRGIAPASTRKWIDAKIAYPGGKRFA